MGGKYIELLGQLKALALDKTRTLTYGRPVVTDVLPFGNHTREHLLACAAGIESYSEHPLAQSVVDAARNENVTLHNASNFEAVLGKGARADCIVCFDKHHCIGKLKFITEEHNVQEEIVAQVEALPAVATKLLFVGLALAGASSLAMAIFADVGVTVLVILNSLRLLKFDPLSSSNYRFHFL